MCPLNLCAAGETVRIEGFHGGGEARRRLHSMGLIPGDEIEIISTQKGPVVIRCRGARLALGQGLANKVMVTCARECSQPAACVYPPNNA